MSIFTVSKPISCCHLVFFSIYFIINNQQYFSNAGHRPATIYDLSDPTEHLNQLGITAEIDVNNGKITQFVNGEPVIQFENPLYDPAHPIVKNFIVNGNDLVIVKDG